MYTLFPRQHTLSSARARDCTPLPTVPPTNCTPNQLYSPTNCAFYQLCLLPTVHSLNCTQYVCDPMHTVLSISYLSSYQLFLPLVDVQSTLVSTSWIGNSGLWNSLPVQQLKRCVCSTGCLHTQFHSKLFVSISNSTPKCLSPYPIPLQNVCLHIQFHSKLVVSVPNSTPKCLSPYPIPLQTGPIINSILNLFVSIPIPSQAAYLPLVRS